MNLHFSPTAIAFLVNTAFVFGFAILVWWRRNIASRQVFAGLLIGIGGWTLAKGMQAAAENEGQLLFWAKFGHISIIALIFFYFIFALEYSQHTAWISFRKIGWIWIVPAITTVFALTNEWHGLVWSGVVENLPASSNRYLSFLYGPVFWFQLEKITGLTPPTVSSLREWVNELEPPS